jgi:hypothetical protein
MLKSNQITDVGLDSLRSSALSGTLRKLKIWNCSKLSSVGILNAVVQLETLSYLNANLTATDNAVLDKCVELDRKMYMCCNRTAIDPKQFLSTHKNTTRETLDCNIYIYKCKKLKFEMSINSIFNKAAVNTGSGGVVINPAEV